MLATERLKLKNKLRIIGTIEFDTAWHIGSGHEGQSSDMGVLLDAQNLPILPGSSIKGKLRSTCERLAPALNLKACLLDSTASGVGCASDVRWYRNYKREHQEAIKNGADVHLDWIDHNTCDICKVFGSTVQAARLWCSDGFLQDPFSAGIRVRDGVVLDRDSHTVVDGLKYDYEVVNAGTRFEVHFDAENLSVIEEALLGAALFDWSAGSTLGAATSRGLGQFHLEGICVTGVDFSNPKERIRYLTNISKQDKMSQRGDWQSYFQTKIANCTNTQN